jgi:TolB-like protein
VRLMRSGVGLAAVLLLVAAAGAIWRLASVSRFAAPVAEQAATAQPAKSVPDLSIVVLPFANLSNDPAQDYFADGITQTLTHDLSRIDGLFIMSRNTAFTYKGKAVDARQIGKELGVRYVLEGSVQRDQSQVRVTAQLTDAATGGQVWGDTFEKPAADLFNLEDEVVAQLANTLGSKLAADIAARAERNPNPDSTDLYFQGLAWLNKGQTPENLAKARDFYQRALDADPNNLGALRDMAVVDSTAAGSYQAADRAGKLASAEAALTEVLSLQPDDASAHMDLAGVLVNSNRGAEGIAEYQRALALDPNLAQARAGIGFAMYVNGRADETEAHVKEALRLSPHDPFAFVMGLLGGLRQALFGPRRGGGRALPPIDRTISQLSAFAPLPGCGAATAGAAGGGAQGGRDRASAQSEIHSANLSRRRAQRQPGVLEAARAHDRRLPRRGFSRGMSETRKIGYAWLVAHSRLASDEDRIGAA